MVTNVELVAAFGTNWVTTVSTDFAEQQVSDADARRVLVEVGLPKSLLEVLVVGDLRGDPPRRLAEVLGAASRGILPSEVRDDLVIAMGLGGVACLSNVDGRVYWYSAGDNQSFGLVNSSLGLFAETMYRLWLLIDDLELEYPDDAEESPAEIGREVRRLVEAVSTIDPPAFQSPVLFWQRTILLLVRGLAADQPVLPTQP